MTLAFGGSVGKEGPAAQIGAALTSLFADILRASVRIRKGSLTERVHQFGRPSNPATKTERGGSNPPTTGD